MNLILKIVAGLTGILGLGVFMAAYQSKFRHIGFILASASYLGACYFSIENESWIPLVVGWVSAIVVRKIFGD
jgi:hypothetical protein